jgi:predicted nicotinamide N-methyase
LFRLKLTAIPLSARCFFDIAFYLWQLGCIGGDSLVKTREFKFLLPGLNLDIAIVDDVEALVTDPEDDDQIPYWAELWPAAHGLARYLWETAPIAGATVLELGAGLGLPGLVAAGRGAQVTMTDFKPEALKIIAGNAARNGLSVRTALADWRDFPLSEQFDWIIGSDILYNPQLTPYVAEILGKNLAPGGQLLLSHPNRKLTLEFMAGQKERLRLQEEHLVVPVQTDDPYFPDYQIDVHRLWR